MSDNRRNFIKKTALLGLSGLAVGVFGKEQLQTLETFEALEPGDAGKLTLPPLPYSYDALEPFIDKQTMEIHHTKHHQGYVDKLNTVSPKVMDFNVDLAVNCKKVNAQSEALFRNNLGGHYNHSLFWTLLKPNPDKKQIAPQAKLSEAIIKHFKSFDAFNKEFSEKAGKIFGSGWCWLIVDENKNLKITTTPNQDNPLMQVASEKGTPILGLDVWEHAYYLKYQNKRADYISNWWNIVNWEKADQLFTGV
jgi:Fe-Mn family superoxide dismutase